MEIDSMETHFSEEGVREFRCFGRSPSHGHGGQSIAQPSGRAGNPPTEGSMLLRRWGHDYGTGDKEYVSLTCQETRGPI